MKKRWAHPDDMDQSDNSEFYRSRGYVAIYFADEVEVIIGALKEELLENWRKEILLTSISPDPDESASQTR